MLRPHVQNDFVGAQTPSFDVHPKALGNCGSFAFVSSLLSALDAQVLAHPSRVLLQDVVILAQRVPCHSSGSSKRFRSGCPSKIIPNMSYTSRQFHPVRRRSRPEPLVFRTDTRRAARSNQPENRLRVTPSAALAQPRSFFAERIQIIEWKPPRCSKPLFAQRVRPWSTAGQIGLCQFLRGSAGGCFSSASLAMESGLRRASTSRLSCVCGGQLNRRSRGRTPASPRDRRSLEVVASTAFMV
jgi:hypothetical protein